MFILSDIWPYLIQVHIYPSPYSLQLLLSQVVPMRVLGFFFHQYRTEMEFFHQSHTKMCGFIHTHIPLGLGSFCNQSLTYTCIHVCVHLSIPPLALLIMHPGRPREAVRVL